MVVASQLCPCDSSPRYSWRITSPLGRETEGSKTIVDEALQFTKNNELDPALVMPPPPVKITSTSSLFLSANLISHNTVIITDLRDF
jgi:hypothetical protein